MFHERDIVSYCFREGISTDGKGRTDDEMLISVANDITRVLSEKEIDFENVQLKNGVYLFYHPYNCNKYHRFKEQGLDGSEINILRDNIRKSLSI